MQHKKAARTIIIVITSRKPSIAVNPGLFREVRVHRTTPHRALLVQRNNNVVIWMYIPLFAFHFFRRVIVCGKTTTRFCLVYSYCILVLK